MHGDGNDRQVVGIVDRLAGDAENGGADRRAGAVGIVGAGHRGRMMRIQFQPQAAGTVPSDIAAQRFVFGPIFSQRSRIGQILALIDAEPLGIEVGSGDRAVGPAARHIVEVEPDAYVRIAHLNSVARIGIVDRRRQIFRWADLEHDLPVQAFAADVVEVIAGVLLDLIDVVGAGTIFDIGETRVALHRQRAPIIFRPQIAVAPADIGLVHACLALLPRSGDGDAEQAIGEGIGNDAGQFRRDRVAVVARAVIDAFHREAAAKTGTIERAGGLDIDGRADAAGRQRRAAGLVDFHTRDAFRRQIGEVEGAAGGRAGAVAQAGCRHLAAVQQHQVEFRAEAANGNGRPFAIGAVDRYAGNTLKRFRQVGIRELADILGRNRVHHALRVAFDIARGGQAGADAGHDDFGGLVVDRRVLGEGRLTADSHRNG